MRNTDIALYLPSLRGGGAERVMVNLANGFARRGLKVDLVLAKAEGPYLSDVLPEVQIVDLKASRVVFSLPGLVQYLRRKGPKSMMATMGHANVVAVFARLLAGKKDHCFLALREATFLGINSKNTPQLRGRLIPWLARIFYPMADALIANSQGSADELKKLLKAPDANIHVIPNPVNIGQILEKAREENAHPLLTQIKGTMILGIGRLTAAKDFATLIRAFSLVRNKRKDALLVLLGEGEQRTELEKLVHEKRLDDYAYLPGFVKNPYQFLKKASVFVLSSRWEGLPNALIEALAVGTPVVSTDCPSGPAEILENGKYGRLVPVGNHEALAKAILQTMENPPDADLRRKRAEDFSVDKIVNQYSCILHGVIIR